MKGFLAVARREIFERRFVFFAAAFASLIPIAMPLVRSWTAGGVVELRSWTAFLLAVVFVVALGVGLGASMLAPAMASRRIGFDFARPVSSLALWSGRFGAALLTAIVAAAIIAIPAWLAGARIPWSDILVDGRPPRFGTLLAAGGFLVLVAAAHAVSVILRSRSGLIALDAALALATGFVVAASLSRLPTFFADEARQRAAWGFALAAGLGLLAAGYVSLERGRTDIRAAHRALSATLWTCIAIGLAGVIAWTSWVLSAGPRNLDSGFRVLPAPAGSWLQLRGEARGTTAAFPLRHSRWSFRARLCRQLGPSGHLSRRKTRRLDRGSAGRGVFRSSDHVAHGVRREAGAYETPPFGLPGALLVVLRRVPVGHASRGPSVGSRRRRRENARLGPHRYRPREHSRLVRRQ